MAWQPLPPTHPNVSDERLIATGGEDCAIFIWNAKVPDSKPKFYLTLQQPIVRLAFTPDGAFLAAATSSQVLIWKVGNFSVPRAMWSRPSHSGWLSPKANSDSEEEDEHCLCWDASGHKLAYGSNSRVSSADDSASDHGCLDSNDRTIACCYQLQQIDPDLSIRTKDTDEQRYVSPRITMHNYPIWTKEDDAFRILGNLPDLYCTAACSPYGRERWTSFSRRGQAHMTTVPFQRVPSTDMLVTVRRPFLYIMTAQLRKTCFVLDNMPMHWLGSRWALSLRRPISFVLLYFSFLSVLWWSILMGT